MNEFSLINQYFINCGQSAYAVDVEIGDDAAVLTPPPSTQLVMTMDTLIQGVHFPALTSPSDIAHKALAVNLSDLAAMGATPAWFLLSLSIPDASDTWLHEFSQSLSIQAQKYAIKLIGGDTCKGPLSITIQATGIIEGQAILRSGAKINDHIFVSGRLGLAALGLAKIQNKLDVISHEAECLAALNCPVPRLDVSQLVKPFAHSMIDISDGLLADLGHILKASECGAELYLDNIPMLKNSDEEANITYALSGGDDYELCFTVPEGALLEMNSILQTHQLRVYDIGKITKLGLNVYKSNQQQAIDLSSLAGFKHFG